MKMLDEKSLKYTKKLILNGYELKAVNTQESLVYINNVNDVKIVFRNVLLSRKAKMFVESLAITQGKVSENSLKNEVVKLVDLGCISEKTAVSEFGKYLVKENENENEREV